MAKEQNTHNQQFLRFRQCFQKLSAANGSEWICMWEWVNNHSFRFQNTCITFLPLPKAVEYWFGIFCLESYRRHGWMHLIKTMEMLTTKGKCKTMFNQIYF